MFISQFLSCLWLRSITCTPNGAGHHSSFYRESLAWHFSNEPIGQTNNLVDNYCVVVPNLRMENGCWPLVILCTVFPYCTLGCFVPSNTLFGCQCTCSGCCCSFFHHTFVLWIHLPIWCLKPGSFCSTVEPLWCGYLWDPIRVSWLEGLPYFRGCLIYIRYFQDCTQCLHYSGCPYFRDIRKARFHCKCVIYF